MKSKSIRMIISLALVAVIVDVSAAWASITTPIQTTTAGSFEVNYWWEIDTNTSNANLYSNAYITGGDVVVMIYPPPEGNGFWYESDNFYDVTVPTDWTKDYSHGIGGHADTGVPGIGWIGYGPGAAKNFVHYSSGLFDSSTINGKISASWGPLYSFSVNVPSQIINTTVAPEPVSSVLFITGGMLIAGRRFIKRKT